MRWSDLLRMSISSLKRRKLRTFLTVLGVVIGTASIVVMFSLGLGLQESMYEEVEKNGGATSLTVTGKDSTYYSYFGSSSGEEESQKYITDDVIENLRKIEHVSCVEPVYNINVIMMKGRYEGYIELTGMTREGLEILNLDMEEGGKLPDTDSSDLQIIFGNALLTNFYDRGTGKYYWDTGEMPDIDLTHDTLFLILDQEHYNQSGSRAYGETGNNAGTEGGSVNISPKKYIVSGCGLIAGGTDNYNSYSFNAFCDLNKLIEYLKKEFRGRVIPGQPSTKGGKPYSKFVYSSAKIQADDIGQVNALTEKIRSMGYNVSSNLEYIESMKKQFAMVQGVLGGIGAVSLFVAAIGIANTMMMSIYERTREIGVMKVIGCGLNNIRQMFLLEAAFIGFAGGILGNILSLILSAVINMVLSGQAVGSSGKLSSIPLWLVLISVGFAVLVGTAAGYFPARRAMRLSPLAAIRNE